MGPNILELDIETFPHKVYCWGLWDQNIGINQIVEPGYTACWAAKWYKRRGVMFSSIVDDGPEAMLQKMHDLLEVADIVIHYNGKKFDMPTLNKEFISYGMEPPSHYKEIDLLQVARRRFKFPSNKLDYVAQALGLGKKVKHMGMELWTECMAGDRKAWALMKKYNKQDVVLLESLYERLRPWIQNHPNVSLWIDSDDPLCRVCGSDDIKKNGLEHTNTSSYQRYKCNDCGAPLRGRNNLNLQKSKVLM